MILPKTLKRFIMVLWWERQRVCITIKIMKLNPIGRAGYGRYDYMIFSHDENKPTIIIELKRVPKDTPNLDQAFTQAAQQALWNKWNYKIMWLKPGSAAELKY